MKLIIALSTLLAVALAAPQRSDDPKDAVILRYDNDNIGVEGYSYSVETSDGQSRSEEGQIVNAGTEDEGISVKGQFSYLGTDGVQYTVTYVADKDGFRPQGAHLPQAN